MGTVQKGGEGAILQQSLKDISAPQGLPKILLPKKSLRFSKGHNKGQAIGHIRQETQTVFGGFKRMTGPITDIAPPIASNTGRKEKIYQIIQEKGELTIKDIAQVAPEYSEKTIQRDLVDMVGNGKLKKKGERRWTVYYI
jgi:predicted HTH transcriptional regulator